MNTEKQSTMTTKKINPIQGLGTDIIEIARIQESIEKHKEHFCDRLFTKKEQAYCNKHHDSAPRYAGRFAAKEALAKALGLGFGEEISFLDLEILPDQYGKPEVHLSEALQKRFNTPILILSISHCKSYATATAIWVTPQEASSPA